MPEQKDDHPLHAAINAKLADVAAASPSPPAWYEPWTSLGPLSTKEERLAVYQAVRAAGSVPADAGFFLVAWMFDLLTDDRAEEGLREVEQHLAAIRQKYGLHEDASAEGDDVPAEYREAMERCHDAWDELYVATLEEHGEHALARLFREDQEQFDQRYEAGRQFFQGPESADDNDEEDDWLDEIYEAVVACMEADSPMGPVGLRYQEEEGFREVTIYPTPVELLGGAHDGAVVIPGFSLDLERLRSAFDSIHDFGWNGLGLHGPEGPYVHVEGIYQGREVYLQVLAQAPEDEAPGLKFDTTRRPRPPE